MKHYHKIHSIFKRNPENKHKSFLIGEYSCPEFEYLKNNEWVFTEKVDGTNIVIELSPDKDPIFGGRTERAQIPADLMNQLIEDFKGYRMDNLMTLYGEGYGPKIQKGGGNYRTDPGFVLFDIYCGSMWLTRENCEEIARTLDIDIVPIIGTGTLAEACNWARNGITSKWGDFRAEGIVARPSVELVMRNGSRVITKVKCKDFAVEGK